MGFRCFLPFLLWVPFCVCVFIVPTSQNELTICDRQECICTSPKAPFWKNIACNLTNTQVLQFEYARVPKESSEIYILGGQELKFSSKTFDTLHGLTLIHINGIKKIVMERKSFFGILSPSLVIEIINCDELIIKSGAFENIQGSISTEIIHTNLVTIEQGAFSKLSNSTFKFIKEIILSEGSFDFKNQGNIGRHGPAKIILFDNVYIPKIPRETFLTSLASVTFQNCKIGEIQSESFKATEISAVLMINTSLENVQKKAFTSRTLIYDFKIIKCNISKLYSEAIMAAMGNLTISQSSIMDIEERAVTSTIARVEIVGNYIDNLHSLGLIFNNWNKIIFDENVLTHLHANFMEASTNSEIETFSFKRNKMFIIDKDAFGCIFKLDEKIIFADNIFNMSCACSVYQWLEEITNSSQKANIFMDTSFCSVDKILSHCFAIPVGIISIRNFTEKACSNVTICETNTFETKILDETNRIYLNNNKTEKQKWLLFMFIMVGLSLIILILTLSVVIIKGSSWLKQKALFRNMQYNSNPHINEENMIEVEDETDKLEIPEELTIEFLQMLSKRLDSPKTHQEASEMIERLYEMFIVEDNYENNNRQNEEAHLYEELGNLNLHAAPPPYSEERYIHTNGPRNILKIMEEKFNTQSADSGGQNTCPALAGDYSEPTDSEIHLYSELRQKNGKNDEMSKESDGNHYTKDILTLLENNPNDISIFQAGPSFKH